MTGLSSGTTMDMVQTGWAHSPWIAALAAILWAAGAVLLPMAPPLWRNLSRGALIVAGVPVLGWLTYCCGPVIGFAAFVAGVLTLTLRPLDNLRARRGCRGLRRTQD